MAVRFLSACLGIVVALGLACTGTAQDKTSETPAPPAKKAASSKAGAAKGKTAKVEESNAKLEKATFGGGCFWCQEAVFERVPGVKTVVSGYAGGTVPNPDYEMVGTGLTGHAEVIQITFDPEVVTFDKLLTIFWNSHDPTTLYRQGPDFGTQYRSIILYQNEEQKEAAQKSFQKLTAAHAFAAPIVTELAPLTRFYPAERYHQDYYRRHRGDPYCEEEIPPKLEMLKYKFGIGVKSGKAPPASSSR